MPTRKKSTPSPVLPSSIMSCVGGAASSNHRTHSRSREGKHINLAVQGGGSHGAFTWGVMHRLLEDSRIYIDGLSGASSGAINGVVAANGFLKDRRQGAIKSMEEFWKRISQSYYNPLLHTFMKTVETPFGHLNMDDFPLYQAIDKGSHLFSPYQLNPMNVNPLRSVLLEIVDFELLRQHPEIRLYVAASNVKRCRARVFRTHEMSVEAVLASTCLPMLYQAVKIDDEYYWDGGYLGNPALYPLVRECGSNDVLVVMVNPLQRDTVPDTAREITNRITELNFNGSLIGEMRSIALINKLLDEGALSKSSYHSVNFHMIEAPAELADYSASSKINTDWDFLRYLHELGWKAADRFLKDHYDDLEVRPTLDVPKQFMDRS